VLRRERGVTTRRIRLAAASTQRVSAEPVADTLFFAGEATASDGIGGTVDAALWGRPTRGGRGSRLTARTRASLVARKMSAA